MGWTVGRRRLAARLYVPRSYVQQYYLQYKYLYVFTLLNPGEPPSEVARLLEEPPARADQKTMNYQDSRYLDIVNMYIDNLYNREVGSGH